MASLISLRSLVPSLSLFFLFFSLGLAESGRSLYLKYCADCHHEDRIGRTAPPLIPELLSRRSDSYLFRVIREGIPASTMPPFGSLSDREIELLIRYMREPAEEIVYGLAEVRASYRKLRGKGKEITLRNPKNLTVVVEKGKGKIWVMEEARVLDRFSFGNVHGGVKFSPDGSRFYVPARDGRVILYDLKEGRPLAEVRACVYLRNISVSRSGDRVVASCVLPPGLVLMDRNLRPLRRIPLEGRPSAIYALHREEAFVLTFRDRPLMAVLEGNRIRYREIEEPLEDFFIDPFERFLIGSSRAGKKLVVYRIEDGGKVYEHEIDALPHLFSSTFWYSGGEFYFATRHVNSTQISVWRMYDWKLVGTVDTGGRGFFVRTHPALPHLWVDNGDSSFVLVDKRTLRVERIPVTERGRATHVEFSADGRYAYISVVGEEGRLLIYDPLNMKLLSALPADHPVGKYNFVMKSRRFYPYLLGREVFMAKCWGCHHQTRTAFGPSLRWIALHRTKDLIISQILNPEETSKRIGYSRSVMPRIDMTPYEVEGILAFMEGLKDAELARLDR